MLYMLRHVCICPPIFLNELKFNCVCGEIEWVLSCLISGEYCNSNLLISNRIIFNFLFSLSSGSLLPFLIKGGQSNKII